MAPRDILRLSFRSIGGNTVRTSLTIAIIAFGIMALIGIITAIAAMNQKFSESFSTMGANAFSIRFRERDVRIGAKSSSQLSKKNNKKERSSSLGQRITKEEAVHFLNNYKYPSITSISIFGGRNNLVAFGSKKTNPNVMAFGADENYLLLNGFTLAAGRNFSKMDVHSLQPLCILGYDVAYKLFGESVERAVHQTVRINAVAYRVIAVLESRGSAFGFSRDNMIILGYENLQQNFPSASSYVMAVMVDDIPKMNEAMGQAEATFRNVRKLQVTEESNFVMDRSDSIAEKAMNSLGFLTISATVIGLITLIGAAIGLMNIMLVAVSERTREVGLIKAIGGRRKDISRQFLMEAVIISVLGSVFGIVLGVGIGNLFSIILGTGFVVPWNWVFGGVVICSVVGLLAGLYPAWKAANLNPIEALRYE